MKKTIILTAFCSLLTINANASDCNQAKKEYETGLKAGRANDWESAKQALIKSTQVCNSFNAWYLLGQVYTKLKNYDDALSTFEDSRKYAKNDNERALAMARYAEIQASQGEIQRPLSMIHEARKMHSNPPKWMTMLAMNLDEKRMTQPLTVAEVTRGLTNKSIRLFNQNARPSVNVNINFKSNSVDIVKTSYQALDVLAEALADRSLASKTITIIGYTDERGTENYNMDLSVKRAKHIEEELISRNPVLNGKLSIVGKGESNPLYKGDDENSFRFNRRVELQVN